MLPPAPPPGVAQRPASIAAAPRQRWRPALVVSAIAAFALAAWLLLAPPRAPMTSVAAPASAASAAGSAVVGSAPSGPGRRFGGANRVQPVSVEVVRRQDIRVTVDAIGSIAASNTATVHAQVSGVLRELHFSEGQDVRPGQLLALIDPRSYAATLAQSEGALARDRAQLDNAKVDLARYRDLLAKDAIPKQQLDTQIALVHQLDGTVQLDQAAVDSARLQLSYTRVTAPIGGRVGLKQVDLGNVVQPGDANGIVTIADTRPVALVFAVPASHVQHISARLRAHEPLPVEAWERGGGRRLAVGRLATADNAIDPATDTIRLKALFANDDDALYPNQAVSVRLQLDTLHDRLAVPSAAVLRGAQGFYVYLVSDDRTVSTRAIKPGAVDGDWTAVEGPLEAGDRVVVDGADRLRDGAPVEVIASDPKQRAGAGATAAPQRRWRGGPDAASAASAPRGAASASPDDAAAAPRPRARPDLSPELAARLQAMSPEERRAWFRERRAASDAAAR